MQLIGSKVRSIALLGAVAACCVLAGDRASASPPPPKFEGFEIVNGCPDAVNGVTVKFYRGDENTGCWAIEAMPAATLYVPSLAAGEVLKLDIPGLWGVAKIHVSSAMPPIPDDPGNPFQLLSDQVDADDVPPAETYTGFTSSAPTGAAPVTPRLHFAKTGPMWNVTIAGSSRWGNHYSPEMTSVRNVP